MEGSTPAPRLAIIGGRLEDTNAAVYAEMHRMAGGRILIFPTASSEPEAVAAESAQALRTHGFEAEPVPLTSANALAFDPGASAAANVERMAEEADRLRTLVIDAAPDLVAATVEALRSVDGGGFEVATLYGGPGIGVDAIEAVRSAIAEAWPAVQVDAVLAAQPDGTIVVALD